MISSPVNVLAISGSLRTQSFNTQLLRAAKLLVEPDIVVEVATLHGIPLYDGDVESAQGSPVAVQTLKAQILAADALLLATPEYNNGIPGVFKNAIDWLSRPSSEMAALFGGRPVALIGASPGGFGTILAQNAWLPVLKALGTLHWTGGRMMLSRAHKAFDESGVLVDETARQALKDFLTGFAQFVLAQNGVTARP
ncbi:MAG TPA: NADPH-dependent FMN reductase [Pseudomonadales bacterium]|nr:NADPH-dependent FMN reductase [Pseudomonadales bacterium]